MTEREIQIKLFKEYCKSYKILIPNYTTPFEMDLFGVTKTGYGVEFEIKISLSDYKRDKEKVKHKYYKTKNTIMPNRFYYVLCFDEFVEYPSEYAGIIRFEYGKPVIKVKAPLIHKDRVSQHKLDNISKCLMYRTFNWMEGKYK